MDLLFSERHLRVRTSYLDSLERAGLPGCRISSGLEDIPSPQLRSVVCFCAAVTESLPNVVSRGTGGTENRRANGSAQTSFCPTENDAGIAAIPRIRHGQTVQKRDETQTKGREGKFVWLPKKRGSERRDCSSKPARYLSTKFDFVGALKKSITKTKGKEKGNKSVPRLVRFSLSSLLFTIFTLHFSLFEEPEMGEGTEGLLRCGVECTMDGAPPIAPP